MIVPLNARHAETIVATDQPQRGTYRRCTFDHRRRRIDIAADRRMSRAKDAGLLAADRLSGRTEVIDVVDADRRDDGHVGIDDVHRVETAAEPDLENHRVDPLAREEVQ